MDRVTVNARWWKVGWSLELVGGGATQVRTLDRAVQQVIDYLDTVDESTDHSDWEIDVVPLLGSMSRDIKIAKAASEAAAKASRQAAVQMRGLVGELRALGMSVTDMAVILGVSRARVSQLARA
ncbi:MAG: antitoxin HicB [Propionibacteriaceae bacterium]|nr:antitoxin HicB [Propionibacteriaceae bacterium]